MKKTTPFFRLIACAIILSATFFACQQDDLSSEELLTANAKFSASAISETSTATLLNYPEDCSSMCIEEGSNTFYKISGAESKSSGGSGNSKEVSYDVYNTESELYVYVTFTTLGNTGSNATITINIDGDEVEIDGITSGTTVSHHIDLPENWTACSEIPFSIKQTGLSQPITFNSSYALIGICPDDCKESFNYIENEDGSYTFTYMSSEDLTDAEIKFTCPHITNFKALDGKEYTVNPGNGQGSPTVLTYTGNLEACSEITFQILFEADCNQNNANFAILFTDFKVNEVSKKGNLENIRFNCSAE